MARFEVKIMARFWVEAPDRNAAWEQAAKRMDHVTKLEDKTEAIIDVQLEETRQLADDATPESLM